LQVIVGVLVLRNARITWKEESSRRIDINAAVDAHVEGVSIEMLRLGGSAVCPQKWLPPEAEVHGDTSVQFPRVLQIHARKILTRVRHECIALLETGQLAQQKIRQSSSGDLTAKCDLSVAIDSGIPIESLVQEVCAKRELVRTVDDAEVLI